MNHFCISVTQRLRNRSNIVSLLTNAADGLVHVGPGVIRTFCQRRSAPPEASLDGLMHRNKTSFLKKGQSLFQAFTAAILKWDSSNPKSKFGN